MELINKERELIIKEKELMNREKAMNEKEKRVRQRERQVQGRESEVEEREKKEDETVIIQQELGVKRGKAMMRPPGGQIRKVASPRIGGRPASKVAAAQKQKMKKGILTDTN